MLKIKKKIINEVNSILIFLFLLILPTQFGKHFFFNFSYLSGVRVDYLAPTIYLTDLIIFFLILVNYQILFDFFRQKKFFILLLLISINLLISQSRFISIYQYLRLFEWLSVFFIFQKRKPSASKILIPLTISGLIQLILALLQFTSKHSIQGIFYFLGERYFTLSTPSIAKASLLGREILRPYGSFSHPNSLAGFYLLLYFLVLTTKRFNQTILKNSFLFISSLLIFISFSKMAIIVFLILNILYLILKIKKTCKVCFLAKTLIYLVVSLVFLQAKSDPFSFSKRWLLIKNSWQIISRYGILGTGAGNYLIVQDRLVQRFADFLNQPVHNVFLLLISEWGILLFSLIVYLVCSKIILLYKKNSWLLVIIFITGFFDHYWLTLNQNFLLLAVVLGGL